MWKDPHVLSLNLRRSKHPQNYPGFYIFDQSSEVFQNTSTVTSPSQLRAELLTVHSGVCIVYLNLISWLQDLVFDSRHKVILITVDYYSCKLRI